MTAMHPETTVTSRRTCRTCRPCRVPLGLAGRAAALLAIGVVALLSRPALTARAAEGRADKEQERTKWENRIVFFGEEDTGFWSLRIPDKLCTEAAKIKYTEMWKYDPASKAWVKVDDGAPAAQIVLPKDKPDSAPPDSQNIADLPI